MHKKEILVSAGAAEYVGGTITETTGKDISAAVFMMSLGSASNPGAWVAPSTSTAGATVASRVVQLLVNNTTARGTYYAWVRVTDAPEVAPVRFPTEIVVR